MLPVLKTNIKISLAAALVFLLCTGVGTVQAAPGQQGIINTFKLNVRKAPSRSADVVVVLKKGDRVDVLNIQGGIGGWVRIEHKNINGYIRNRPQYIRLLKKPVDKKTQARNRAKKKVIEKEIQTQESMVKTFSQKEVEIIEGLNEIDYALNKARIKVAALAGDVSQLEDKISGLKLEGEKLVRDISINQDYAGSRLKALYKMNMIGRLDLVGLPTSVFDFFLQQNAMKRIIQSDFNLLEKQNSDLEKLELLEKKLKQEINEKSRLEAELKDQIRINDKETLKREMILKEIRQKKKLSMAAVESLKHAAIALDNQIKAMDTGNRNGLNQFAFSSYKGRLIHPVKGKIISTYGPSNGRDDKTFTFQKGIDIKVERGEPVKSVFKGKVMFAQWLKGYGNLLIINHGENYYTLYAHVEEIFKGPGESVDTGEVIATAGDTGSIKGMCLHFEVRHHGKPVNPLKWLKKGVSS